MGRILFSLVIVAFTTSISGQALDDKTIAIFEGKEKVSLQYYSDIYKRLQKDAIGRALMKGKTPFRKKVLGLLAENYILWKEAKKQGFHHRSKFKSRFLTAIQGYFAEYVSKQFIKQGKIKPHEKYDRNKINQQLWDFYKVQVNATGLSGANGKEVFKETRKSPSLELYKPLPKAEYTPYSRFEKKAAEKIWAIRFRMPGESKKTELNYRQVLSRMPDYDFYKFRAANGLVRNEMLMRMVAGDLIPVEFKRLAEKDPYAKEYIRRVEQVTLARFYRIVRGIDYSSNYVLLQEERSLEPVSITNDEMKAYYKQHLKDFRRPKTANVWMVRYTKKEIERGDKLIEQLREIEYKYDDKRKDAQDQGQILLTYVRNVDILSRQLKKHKKGSVEYKKIDTRLQTQIKKKAAEKAKLDKLNADLDKLEKDIPNEKFKKFNEEIDYLNALKSRQDGSVKQSGPLGTVTFDAKKKMKRYENIAFTVPTSPINGKESILFASGEDDYVVLFVKNNNRQPARFEDPMVQRKIRNALELKKRSKIVKDLVRKRMKKVLARKYVNRKLLKTFKK